ncbi:protein WVD2-like 7 isoform X2 [Silene latifolia]|uniref:protein WVD2-like 7 isoform X2 n=1 Tax=Silene latifolia TaxID=37657 RepID=UPI003D783043
MDENEPTCVMHPFSYTNPPPSSFSQEKSIMYGVEESVSFGRFVSDNLDWEKWSSFNNNRNRYVQEAEKYSRPGSVAQKKAYFEAHFKRMAALKAAALLEQANSLQNSSNDHTMGSIQSITSIIDVQTESNNCENEDAEAYVIHQNDKNEAKENLCENVGPIEPSNRTKVYSVPIKNETFNGSNEIQSCGTDHRDKPPLQRSSFIEKTSESIVKKNPPLSSYMSPAVGGTARASLFENSVYPGKENFVTPTKNKTRVTDQDKKKTPLRLSINREFNRIISPVIRKIGTSSKVSKDCSAPMKTPAKTPSAALESPRMTPSRGARSRLDSFAGDNKASGSRWHIFSSDASMSPSTGRQRIRSPIIPNSFCLNGERASKRKQKLEDKFNATAIERPPQSSKFKEKAEAELNKFRQSFCFKAMSSPDHLGENEALTSPKQKNGFTQGKSPKRGKQSAKTISKSFLPPRRPSNSVK